MGADVLPNGNGTAPGIYVPPRLNPVRPCAIFLLPGPPRELYPMFLAEVEPRLRALAGVAADRGMLELKFTGVGRVIFIKRSMISSLRSMDWNTATARASLRWTCV